MMIRNVTKSAKKSDPKNMIILCNSEDDMMIFATNFVDQFFPFCSSFISRPLFFIWPPRKPPIILKKDMLIEQLKCKKDSVHFFSIELCTKHTMYAKCRIDILQTTYNLLDRMKKGKIS